MIKVLDITARVIVYDNLSPKLPYHEERTQVIINEGTAQDVSITNNDISICRFFTTQDNILQSLCHTVR
jgi:hypothetical protein